VREKKSVLLICTVFLMLIVIAAMNVSNSHSDTAEAENDNYISSSDMDHDGIDDQTDILTNAKKYIAAKPEYIDDYYDTGYPVGNYGVCTDVIGYALKNSGYDLMTLVNDDILKNPKDYPSDTRAKPDINIDFRRVKNLRVYFRHTAISLTTDITQTDEWQGGDIVVFEDHIGIISDKRNKDGVPLLIHHSSRSQTEYEEDVLGKENTLNGEITDHFRIGQVQ